MSPAATHGVVSLAALDLRPRPDHRAELASQLLVGETVRLLGRPASGWVRVQNLADGYRGWVKEWGIVPADEARSRRWRALARARVVAPFARVLAGPGAGGAVSPLFLGGRVIAGRARGGFRTVELPDGRRGHVEAAALRDDARGSVDLVERATSLLGTPYLWGGRTPAGYDCSGLVQQMLLEQGVILPRDAHEQSLACRALRRGEDPGEGDLVFFSADGRRMHHVGVGLGGGFFLHARGMVRVATMDESNPLWDRELAPQCMGWRRPVVRGGVRAGRAKLDFSA